MYNCVKVQLTDLRSSLGPIRMKSSLPLQTKHYIIALFFQVNLHSYQVRLIEIILAYFTFLMLWRRETVKCDLLFTTCAISNIG